MADILLATKTLVPPLRSRLVNRPHLVQRLYDGILQAHHLTLIPAPAGFRKTTLICVRTVAPEPGNPLLAMMQSPQPPAAETALTVLINGLAECPELSPQKPLIVLVLDDYHEVVADAVHSAILFLLDHMPPQFHLVTVTRVDPPWPLARLRASRGITELRAGDLPFAPEETRAFLNGVMCLAIEKIPIDKVRSHPWLSIAYAWALKSSGRFEDAESSIQNIESFLEEQRIVSAEENDTSQIKHMRGHIATLRSFLATPTGKDWNHEIDLARQALELLPQSDLRMHAFVTGWLASLLESNSDLEAAMQARTTEEAGFDYLLLASVLRAEGNADAAHKEMNKIHRSDQQISQIGTARVLNSRLVRLPVGEGEVS